MQYRALAPGAVSPCHEIKRIASAFHRQSARSEIVTAVYKTGLRIALQFEVKNYFEVALAVLRGEEFVVRLLHIGRTIIDPLFFKLLRARSLHWM